MIVLVDCNNFFASCEMVANPSLRGKPIVVVSGTGGIVLARSQEAKALGIPMGACSFKYEDLFRKAAVHVMPCNFHLYSSLSAQVMETLRGFSPDIEEYSIDEAFLIYNEASFDWAKSVRKKVFQNTKIPVSVGIGKTKVLAKAAVYFAKKSPDGVCEITDEHLAALPVEEIWGVGANTARRLHELGIYTAEELKNKHDYFLRKELSVHGLSLAMELRGVSCMPLAEGYSRHKSISTARALKKVAYTCSELEDVAANYVKKVVATLREEQQSAQRLTVFIATSPFGSGEKYYNESTFSFSEPTSYLPELTLRAKELVRQIFCEGYAYKKVGVILSELLPEEVIQYDLFNRQEERSSGKKERIMQVVEELNQRFGKEVIVFGE